MLDVLLAPYGINPETKEANSPNPTQFKILDWVDKKRANKNLDALPVLYVQGGVGSGKSRGILAPVYEMLTQIPELRVLWGRSDFKDLKLSIIDLFTMTFPVEMIVGKSEQYHWYDIKTQGKPSRLFFNGLKDLSGLGSQEFGVIVVSEAHELTEQAYRTLKRRCRQANTINMILMEGEAPNEGHWLANLTDPSHPDYDKDIEMWQVSTYENWENLPQSYKGSLEGMPEAWKRKYLQGEFGFKPDGKPYYQGFKEHIHTGEFEWIKTKPLICGWDFGYHHPAVVVTQIDHLDRWVWLREFMGTDVTIDQFADYMKEQLNYHFPGGQFQHFGDPAVIQKTDKSELTSWQILRSKGFHIIYKTSTYRDRKEIIEGKLSSLVRGVPKLMLDNRHCKVAVDGFLGGYHYPAHKEGQAFNTQHELPFRDGYYEHIMNAGEYIAVNMFSAVKSKKRIRMPYRKRRSPDNI